MKKNIFIAALFVLIWGNCAFSSQISENVPVGKQMEAANNPVNIQLPPALYAVPGTELNIYFDNIVLVNDINAFNFDVECQYGRQDRERWRYVPNEKDVGKFPLKIKVYDSSSRLIAERKTEVFVSPKDSGKGKSVSVMLVGDSLTGASIYPQELYNLFKKDDGLNVRFVGTNSSAGYPVKEGLAAHEGRGGWTWARYCKTFEDPKESRPVYKSSPFLVRKGDEVVLNFKSYCDKNNDGKAPDYITLFLGINDIFSFDDAKFDEKLPEIFASADTLINEFKRVAPDAKIGIVLIPPPAATQDAFGENYKCGQTRWQYRKNQHRYVDALMKKFGGRESENLFLIPVYVNIDCVNNYPQKEEPVNARNPKKIFRNSNGVHPAKEGYWQIADSFYAWFKFELSKEK